MAELVVVKGAHRGDFATIGSGSVTIGRSDSTELCLNDDSKVSQKHATVTRLDGERFILEDLESTNGTFVNGERIEQAPLRSGDLIKIGRSLLIFRADGSSVRLEDLKTLGGGTTGRFGRQDKVERAATSSAVQAPKSEGEDASEEEPADDGAAAALQELLVVAGDVVLQQALDGLLDVVLRELGARRALLFLRHPFTGGLGCAAFRHQPGVPRDAPVDADLLTKAVSGEVSTTSKGAAAPVRILGFTAGVLYADGCSEGPQRLEVLAGAALLAGLDVGIDRSRRLASSAAEIVSLGQAQVQQRVLDLVVHLREAERMYTGAATARGLKLEVDVQDGLEAAADPVLFGRGLDKLVEHVLGDAVGTVKVQARAAEEGAARLELTYTSAQQIEATQVLIDPAGVAGDLRRAWDGFGDGNLAVARVALVRAGGSVSVRTGDSPREITVSIDLEPSPTDGDL